MNKLTDLEICKRIAEIDGVKVRDIGGVICILEATGSSLMKTPTTRYNPLTDDALCFKFCYEDEITVNKCVEVINGELVWNGKYYARHPKNENFGSVADTPNKAVCLEKIEAHKE
tara:strand:- start:505 stop:849 length:345 start_codon:yes stop_codon:yes gene_type:complete